MGRDVQTKRKDYFSEEEFEKDRKKMFAAGWVIASQRIVPGKAPYLTQGSGLELLFWPILWLFNRTQPKEILIVEWVRERR